jgi:hypothetical protein
MRDTPRKRGDDQHEKEVLIGKEDWQNVTPWVHKRPACPEGVLLE